MWNQNKSIIASIVMTGGIFIMIMVSIFLLPWILKHYSYMSGRDVINLAIPLYISAAPGIVCTFGLMNLLINIRKNEIFIGKNVTILRMLSWCCIFVGFDYLAFSPGHIAMLILSFAAFFFGLILRVIKNVFDKAIEIREENDYTV